MNVTLLIVIAGSFGFIFCGILTAQWIREGTDEHRKHLVWQMRLAGVASVALGFILLVAGRTPQAPGLGVLQIVVGLVPIFLAGLTSAGLKKATA